MYDILSLFTPTKQRIYFGGWTHVHDVKVIYTLQYVSTSSLLQSPNNKNKSNLHAVPLIKGTFYLRIQEITLYGMLTLM